MTLSILLSNINISNGVSSISVSSKNAKFKTSFTNECTYYIIKGVIRKEYTNDNIYYEYFRREK
jgi:hypothetical protein